MYSLGSFSQAEPAHRIEALVVVVDLLLHVGHPAEVDLGEDHVELGEAVEHAGEDHLDHPVRRVEEAAVAGQLGPVRGGHRLASATTWMLSGTPRSARAANTLSSSGSIASVPFGQQPITTPRMPGRSMTRSISATASSTPAVRAGSPARRSARARTRRTRRSSRCTPGPSRGGTRRRWLAMIASDRRGRRVEHLGVDAVAIHLVEPRGRVVAAVADVLEARPSPSSPRARARRRRSCRS